MFSFSVSWEKSKQRIKISCVFSNFCFFPCSIKECQLSDVVAVCLVYGNRNSEAAVTLRSESRRVSPDKEERSYTTRGSVPVLTNLEENGGGKVPQVDVNGRGHGAAPGYQGGDEHTNHYHSNYKNNNYSNRGGGGGGGGNLAWPKLCITLSSKEKEEDFLAMKGCKLPQRPKKRAKLIQRTILVSSILFPFLGCMFNEEKNGFLFVCVLGLTCILNTVALNSWYTQGLG